MAVTVLVLARGILVQVVAAQALLEAMFRVPLLEMVALDLHPQLVGRLSPEQVAVAEALVVVQRVRAAQGVVAMDQVQAQVQRGLQTLEVVAAVVEEPRRGRYPGLAALGS